MLAALLSGCAAHRPLKGIPISQVPEEWRYPITYRSGRDTIDLSLLRQTPPADHRIDAGDVLGIYIDGILGGDGQLPPVSVPQNAELPPSLGYPVTVRGDGTISLPGYEAFNVRGLTLRQVEDRIRAVCGGGDEPLLVAGNERIIVSLQRPRVARVLVIRQEAGNEPGHGPQTGETTTNRQKRGTGRVVALPAYRNDVLHALAETGGLPGLDAENVIYIVRGAPGRQPAVAPAPERNVQRPGSGGGVAGADRSGAPAVSAARVSRRTVEIDGEQFTPRGAIQLAGGLVDDPFLQSPAEAEPRAGAARTRPPVQPWSGPSRIADSTRDWRPAGPDRRSVDSPDRVLPAPGAGTPSGHSSVDERFEHSVQAQPEGPLPPPPTDLPPGAPGLAGTRTLPALPPIENITDIAGWTGRLSFDDATVAGSRVIRIPLKLLPGELPQLREEDILLHDGDVVFVESRDCDFFLTGGLLGGGQYPLPRDYDITVIDAIAIAEQMGANRPLPTRALGGVSALNQDVTVGASKVVVLRKLPDGCEIPIEIDLHAALRDPHQRLIIQAGDRVILRYTRMEAIAAFFERHILDGAVIGLSTAAVFRN